MRVYERYNEVDSLIDSALLSSVQRFAPQGCVITSLAPGLVDCLCRAVGSQEVMRTVFVQGVYHNPCLPTEWTAHVSTAFPKGGGRMIEHDVCMGAYGLFFPDVHLRGHFPTLVQIAELWNAQNWPGFIGSTQGIVSSFDEAIASLTAEIAVTGTAGYILAELSWAKPALQITNKTLLTLPTDTYAWMELAREAYREGAPVDTMVVIDRGKVRNSARTRPGDVLNQEEIDRIVHSLVHQDELGQDAIDALISELQE